jgi:hypothetical protein
MFGEATAGGCAFGPEGCAIGAAVDIGIALAGLFEGLFGGGGPSAIAPSLATPSSPILQPSPDFDSQEWNEQVPDDGSGAVNSGTLFGSGNTDPFIFSFQQPGFNPYLSPGLQQVEAAWSQLVFRIDSTLSRKTRPAVSYAKGVIQTLNQGYNNLDAYLKAPGPVPGWVCVVIPDGVMDIQALAARRMPPPTDESGNAGAQVVMRQRTPNFRTLQEYGSAERDAAGAAAALATSQALAAAQCLSRR